MPVGELAIGRAGVVSPEDLGHEQEELPEPPLLQGPGNGVSPFSFTEGLTLHMRVRDVLAAAGATRIEGDDLIGLGTAELIQREANLEGAEIDSFQDNAFGADTERLGEPVDVDPVKFLRQRLQFLQQQPEGGNVRRGFQTFQIFGLMQTVLGESTQGLSELASELFLRRDIAAALGEVQTVLQPLDPEPVFLWQGSRILRLTVPPVVLLLQVLGDPQPGTAAEGKVHVAKLLKKTEPLAC